MTTTEPQPNTEGEWIPRYFTDFRREFDAFKDENTRQHAETNARISETNARLAEAKVDLIKWMVGTMLGVTAVWGGVVYTVVATLS